MLGSALEPMDLGENEAEAASDDPVSVSGVVSSDAPPAVIESAAVDIDALCVHYTGHALMQRLLFVADVCPSLRREALHALVHHVQQSTFNIALYQQAHNRIAQCANELGGEMQEGNGDGEERVVMPGYDQTWVDSTAKKAQLKLDRLDADLKHYKNNSIKESIRRGQDELGDHYLDVGNLADALKCYNRARDYCTSYKHILNMCFNVIKVAAYLNNWQLVASYVARAESGAESAVGVVDAGAGGNSSHKEAQAQRLAAAARLKAAAGLAELASHKYRNAARCFLQIEMDHFSYPDLLTSRDVAVYGSLCALATYSRVDLQKHVLQNNVFKQFLELEPQLSELIRRFTESAYSKCLAIMAANRDRLSLDMYLSAHVNPLFEQIRRRGLVQYFSPFLSADMNLMAQAFQSTINELEDEVSDLILKGEINARIDSHTKTLYAKDVDERSAAYKRAFSAGLSMEQRARAVMLRAAVNRAKICVTRGGSRTATAQSLASVPDAPSSGSSLGSQFASLLAGIASSSNAPPPVPQSAATSSSMNNNAGNIDESSTIDTPPENSAHSSPSR